MTWDERQVEHNLTEEERLMLTWHNEKPVTFDVAKHCVPEGWQDLLQRLLTDLEAMGSDAVVLQIKEKFAELRFYATHVREAEYTRIMQAMVESQHTCMTCGKPGAPFINSYGWRTVGCPDHIEPGEHE